MPNCVNAAMNAVQAAGSDATGDTLAAYPRALKLLERDHPVLIAGKTGNEGVTIGVG